MARTPTTDLYSLYTTFPFATDEQYQQGLNGILAGGALEGKSPEDQAQIMRHSRVFYFNRVTGNTITADDALAFEQLLPAQTPPPEQKSEAAEEELRTLTFSELKALIEQGKTDGIPNNRVIPDILSDDKPSESKATIRPKPWESTGVAVTTS